jgi:hypothetical protein
VTVEQVRTVKHAMRDHYDSVHTLSLARRVIGVMAEIYGGTSLGVRDDVDPVLDFD